MPKTFYIIDGHAQIFRAYFAPFRDLTSPDGEPTKATFVFTQMMLNLAEARQPDYLAMVVDEGDEFVFRTEIYPEYKANRPPPPDDFYPQEQRIMQIIRASGVPLLSKPGFEADDVIATMVEQLRASDEDWRIVLVSKDKDLRQLLDDHVVMYDVNTEVEFGPDELYAKLGFRPERAVDVQTLVGDSVDNVPGVHKVGEKTAVKLLDKYGSVEAIFEHLDELSPKQRENFEAFRPNVELTRQLVTLKRDVDIPFDPKACRFTGFDVDQLSPLMQQLGFTSLQRKLETVWGDAAANMSASTPKAPPKPKPSVDGGLFGDLEPERPKTSRRRLAAPAPSDRPPAETSDDCDYQLVNSEQQLDELITELQQAKRFALDTETDALGAMYSNLVGLSFAVRHKHAWYVPLQGTGLNLDPVATLAKLKPLLEDVELKKIGHNIKYDLLSLRKAGVDVRGVSLDTMIAAALVDSGRISYGIDKLALDKLNFQKIATGEVIGGRRVAAMDMVPLDRIARYAGEDADIALRLADLLESQLKELPEVEKLAGELETPLVEVLANLEFNGIAVDKAVLKEQSKFLGERIDKLRNDIMDSAGVAFNPDSPKQLADVLFVKLKLKVVKRTKSGPSTDVEVLERLADQSETARLMLEYRQLVKLKGTYLDALGNYISEATGRIHASFSQIGAETGRLSCNDPNLQNIPIRTDEGRAIRKAFVPGDAEKNVLLTADYSQIELRVLAHFCQEPALLEAFNNNQDIHAAVAAQVFAVKPEDVSREQRSQAKVINFGIIYGITATGLARRIDGLDRAGAARLIRNYNERFPGIEKFLNKCIDDAQAQGYVTTILGRRRAITNIASGVVSLRNAAERMAINSVVQGSAADLIKVAMLNIHRRIISDQRPSHMLLQVHDELVFETPVDTVEAEADMVREEMINAMTLSVPLQVEAGWGKNWQEVK